MSETQKIIDEITIRKAEEGDLPYIFSTWLKAYQQSQFARQVRKTNYFKFHHLIIEGILAKSDAICACFKSDPEIIVGYLISGTWTDPDLMEGAIPCSIPIIHFAFVKQQYQREGIFLKMIKEAGFDLLSTVILTHLTTDAKSLMQKYPNLEYIPYLI